MQSQRAPPPPVGAEVGPNHTLGQPSRQCQSFPTAHPQRSNHSALLFVVSSRISTRGVSGAAPGQLQARRSCGLIPSLSAWFCPLHDQPRGLNEDPEVPKDSRAVNHSHTEAGKWPAFHIICSTNTCGVDSCHPSQPHSLPSFLQSGHGVPPSQQCHAELHLSWVSAPEPLSPKRPRESSQYPLHSQHKHNEISQPQWDPEEEREETSFCHSLIHWTSTVCPVAGQDPSPATRPGFLPDTVKGCLRVMSEALVALTLESPSTLPRSTTNLS